MHFGYDQYMAGRLRMYVEESEEITVLVDDMRGDFLVDDFAEDAILHADILSWQARSGMATGGHDILSI